MNTINPVNNVSFNSRYISVKSLDKLPPRIKEAILKNDAIDKFIKAGEPKTFMEKVINFFTRDEGLYIRHYTTPNAHVIDPYSHAEVVYFSFGKDAYNSKIGELRAEQKGWLRPVGSIPKPGENSIFIKPKTTAEDKLVQMIENIKDFGSLLK